jgi:hypothetical protein
MMKYHFRKARFLTDRDPAPHGRGKISPAPKISRMHGVRDSVSTSSRPNQDGTLAIREASLEQDKLRLLVRRQATKDDTLAWLIALPARDLICS